MSRLGVRLALVLVIAATIGCDRVTKQVAVASLAEAPGRSFLADTVRLEYVENAVISFEVRVLDDCLATKQCACKKCSNDVLLPWERIWAVAE